METFGLLRRGGTEKVEEEMMAANAPAVVEFGAGRGYLTQMLEDCYGIRNVLLVERRSYKLKADRSLRQNEGITLKRLKIDIEDLNLHGIEALSGVPYLAIGKHICGSATDMTILSCLHEHEASTSKIGEDQLFYVQQRGIDHEKAVAMICGFCKAVFDHLPLVLSCFVFYRSVSTGTLLVKDRKTNPFTVKWGGFHPA